MQSMNTTTVVRQPFPALLLLALCLPACSDDASSSASQPAADSGTPEDATSDVPFHPDAADASEDGSSLPALAWVPCEDNGNVWPDAECTEAPVPYRHDEAGGKTIPVFVKRVRATSVRRGQLWLIEGGPGPSGADYLEPQHADVPSLFPDLDVYVLDHRGTGPSILACPDNDANAQTNPSKFLGACFDEMELQWGPRMAGFSVTEAARDLGYLIAATRAPGDQVYVYGRSYGTALVTRYLQIHPDQASGVVLDSYLTPETDLARNDADYDAVAKAYFEGCAADAECKAHLTDAPWAFVGSVLAKLENGHCADLATKMGSSTPLPMLFRALLGGLMKTFEMRAAAAPIVYRFDRCLADDVTAIVKFFKSYQPKHAPPHTLFPSPRYASWVLMDHITFSELTLQEVTPAEMLARFEAGYASSAIISDYYNYYAAWRRYEPDAYWKKWPETSIPVLVLQGEMDPATPAAAAALAKTHFSGEHQWYVSIPRASHVTVLSSPMTDGTHCGSKIFEQFVKDPAATLDVSCTQQVLPFDFAAASLDPSEAFGRPTVWD